MKTNLIKYMAGCFILVQVLTGCSTDDVEPTEDGGGTTPDLVLIPDDAFGEYMLYNETAGVYEVVEDGAVHYYLDPTEVAAVNELLLSKTSSNVANLTTAGLATAETKITDLTGIEYFVGLQHLVLTSNSVTSLDVSDLTALQELELNFNLIGSLDLSNNPQLTLLRYKGSSSAEENQKLSTIDLSNNTALKHLYLPNHNFVTIDLSNNLAIDEMLDMSGNPGPDGDPDTADIVVPAAIYDQLAPENRLGVVSDANVTATVFLAVDNETISEADGMVTITVSLNAATNQDVTVVLSVAGTATQDTDYTLSTTSIVVPAGLTSATATLSAIQDDEAEGNETVVLDIESVTNAEAAENQAVTINIEDDEIVISLLINEVLYDPSNDALDGDANGDGAYSQAEDEFIEFYNDSDDALDMSGFMIYDADGYLAGTPNHTFPAGTIVPAHGAIVVFGGGTPTGSFGGAVVQTSTTGDLNMNNADDLMTITDAEGNVLLTFNIEPLSNNPNESYTRNPDITGEFVQHSSVNGALFSPGTKADGTSF